MAARGGGGVLSADTEQAGIEPADTITISDLVVAKLAAHAARQTYGVVDMRSTPMRRVAAMLRGTEGVEARVRDGAAQISLHVIMERGVNVAQVTAILRAQVAYEITQGTGLQVDDVAVKVEDLRE